MKKLIDFKLLLDNGIHSYLSKVVDEYIQIPGLLYLI